MAAYCLNRASLLFASHVEEWVKNAVGEKTGKAAEAAAFNALAPWIGAQPKFAEPVIGNH